MNSVLGRPSESVTEEPRPIFFLTFAMVLLAIVLVGFSPTLYLRPIFDPPAIPLYLYVHGLVVTAWFLWFSFQTSLIATSRIDIHRRAGIGGVAIGIGVVVLGVFTILHFPARFVSDGGNLDAVMPELSAIVWANMGMLLMFCAFVALAVIYRKKGDAHKRLMLFASLSIIAPAVDRISRWPVFSGIEVPVVTPVMLILLLATPIAYEVFVLRRLHAVTIGSASCLFLAATLPGAVISVSDVGRGWIIWLAGNF